MAGRRIGPDERLQLEVLWRAGHSIPRIAELIGRAVTKTDGDPGGAAAREIRSEVRELVGAFPAYPRG